MTPWSKLPRLLAEQRFILINFPSNLFPVVQLSDRAEGSVTRTSKTTKGVSSFTVSQREALIDALTHKDYPLGLKRYPGPVDSMCSAIFIL